MHRLTTKDSQSDFITDDCTENKCRKQDDVLNSNRRSRERSKSRSPIRKTNVDVSQNTISDDSNIHTEARRFESKNSNKQLSASCKTNTYGPALPPHLASDVYGPVLPKFNTQECQREIFDAYHNDQSNSIPEKEIKIYGPALPPHLKNSGEIESGVEVNKDKRSGELKQTVFGPQLPYYNRTVNEPSSSSTTYMSDDDDCFGPLPPNAALYSETHIALEERALQMKLDYLHEEKNPKVTREEWMTELPDVHSKNLGLGPRQFRSNPRPDFSDRSSWTDTPQDKEKKTLNNQSKVVDLKQEAKVKEQEKYDREQEKIIKKHKKNKKEKTLLEIHRSNLKAQKKEDGNIRRPFSREIDLKVNHFDNVQKEAILKKAQLLDDRFSKGQSKFL